MRPANLLIFLSDEHQRDITGCYGNPLVKTPNIDRLAAAGVRFTNASTPCPICVPARSSIATGRYVHDTGAWDNAHPYHGEIPSWGHRLREHGYAASSIGKLHFRASQDDNGFAEEILPLHVLDGVGDLLGLLRAPPAARGNMPALARESGAGQSTYNAYDTAITEAACDWLVRQAQGDRQQPWVLFVSFVRPHFPLLAPDDFFSLYPPDAMPWPRLYRDARALHPAVQAVRDCMNYDDYFDAPSVRRAVAAYYGLVSFLDNNIGLVLKALADNGLSENTRVIYTSDHGDNLGNRGLWGKSVMYEESVAVPLLMSGPQVPVNAVVDTPVSLVDLYQTVLDAVGCPRNAEDDDLPGHSLWRIAEGEKPDRVLLSEYHAVGSITGSTMIRRGRWKFIYHVGYRPELFDLRTDPGEVDDLAADPRYATVVRDCETALRRVVDPETTSRRAFTDQHAKIAAYGGDEAIRRRGDFGYTPAPGEEAEFA